MNVYSLNGRLTCGSFLFGGLYLLGDDFGYLIDSLMIEYMIWDFWS